MPTPSSTIMTSAKPMDLSSTRRNGGVNIWVSVLTTASIIPLNPPAWAMVRTPGDGSSSGCGSQCFTVRRRRRLRLAQKRRGGQIRPLHRLVVETIEDGRLHHLEIRRNVEVARRIKRGMPDLQNFPPRAFAFQWGDLRQDRIAHALESLRN